jgi:hypothetical protein
MAAANGRITLAISTEFGILPERGSLLLAYRDGDNGETARHQDRSVTLGGIHHLHQNVQLQLH